MGQTMRTLIRCLGWLGPSTMLMFGAAQGFASEMADCGHPIPDRSIHSCSLLIERGGAGFQELAAAHLRRGAATITMGDFDRAVADLEVALRLKPNDPEAHTTLGDAYLRKAGVVDYIRERDATVGRGEPYTKTEQNETNKRHYEQAIASYNQALELNPRHLAAYFGRSLAHGVLGHDHAADNDRRAANFPGPRHIHRSQSAYVTRQFALVLDSQGYRKTASERFLPLDEAIRQSPNDPKPYLDRAWAFINYGQSARAIADYSQAIRLAPGNAEPYRLRGEEFLANREHSHALVDFDVLVRLDPNHFRGYDLRGLIHERMGEREKAIADYRKALLLDGRAANAKDGIERLSRIGPDPKVLASSLFRRCMDHITSGDYDRALSDCDEAIRLDPARAKLDYGIRARAFARKGEFDRAIGDFTRAIDADPSSAHKWFDRGDAHFRKGNYRPAIADFNETLRLGPGHGGALARRAWAYFQIGDYDQAIVEFSELVRARISRVEAYTFRGRAYAQKGDYDRAIADYDEAISLRPSPRSAPAGGFLDAGPMPPYFDRGLAYEKKAERHRAIADYQTVLSFDSTFQPAKDGLERLGTTPRSGHP
jgi:tetratricopeptide (TPR) repeat protein